MNDDPHVPTRVDPMSLSRRRFLKTSMGVVGAAALAPAAAALAACAPTSGGGAAASGGPKKVITIAVSRGINSSAIWNLVNLGPKYGFNVQISELFTYADQQKAVQNEQVMVATTGVTNPSTLLDSGVTNLKVIAGQLDGGSNIIIRKGVTANTWKDLEGKTLGATPGTYARIEFLIAAKEHGVDVSKINLVNISSPATALDSLTKKDVDGIVLFSPTTDIAVVQDLAYYPEHIDIGDSSLGPANGLLLANDKFIADTELSTNFMKAYVDSVNQMHSEDAFVTLGTLVASVQPDVCKLAFKYLWFSEKIDVDALTKAAKLGPDNGFAKTDVSAKIPSIINFGPLKAATGKSEKDLTGTPSEAIKQVRK